MNLKETIRKVLLEETKLSNFLRRRVGKLDQDELDNIMDMSLNKCEVMIKKYFGSGKNEPMTFSKFSSLVMSFFIDTLFMKDIFREDNDVVYNELHFYYSQIYYDRIKKYYDDNNIKNIY
jgi:hypothetical protein